MDHHNEVSHRLITTTTRYFFIYSSVVFLTWRRDIVSSNFILQNILLVVYHTSLTLFLATCKATPRNFTIQPRSHSCFPRHQDPSIILRRRETSPHASLSSSDIKARYNYLMHTSKASSSTPHYRWRSLSLPSFLALWLFLPCIGCNDEISLRGPKNILWLGTFYQCPEHSNGRRLRSGDKNTVCDAWRLWFSAQYNVLCRFRYYSCRRFRDIDDYLKYLRSRHWPSRPKI